MSALSSGSLIRPSWASFQDLSSAALKSLERERRIDSWMLNTLAADPTMTVTMFPEMLAHVRLANSATGGSHSLCSLRGVAPRISSHGRVLVNKDNFHHCCSDVGRKKPGRF